MCVGQISGIEAAVHAVKTIFNSSDTEAVLLVDTTNAFNSLNRQVALHNIRRLCPPLATILINTYRAPTDKRATTSVYTHTVLLWYIEAQLTQSS